MSDSRLNLHGIVAEGCVDRFCGRPYSQNPYAGGTEHWAAWNEGWAHADWYLQIRGQEEATRWLREAS